MRFFNTSGPVVPADHYCIPPLERVDLDDVCQLVRNERYFVLHAPRQTGKTSVLLALRDLLNSGAVGDYRCVYFNVEVGQAGREYTARAMRAIFRELATWARVTLKDSLVDEIWPGLLDKFGPDGALGAVLNRWAEADRKPLVLLIDEIDSLVGDTLISVLRQLRASYVQRPERFPQSVVLCGLRDVRDYRIHSGTDNTVILGGSAFNIKARSMRLGGPVPRGGAGVAGAAHRGDVAGVHPGGTRLRWMTSRPRRSSSSSPVRPTSMSWPTSSRRIACTAWSSRC